MGNKLNAKKILIEVVKNRRKATAKVEKNGLDDSRSHSRHGNQRNREKDQAANCLII